MLHKSTSKFDAVLFFFGKKKRRGEFTVLSVTLERICVECADTHQYYLPANGVISPSFCVKSPTAYEFLMALPRWRIFIDVLPEMDFTTVDKQ
jgi:hypothetical protein